MKRWMGLATLAAAAMGVMVALRVRRAKVKAR